MKKHERIKELEEVVIGLQHQVDALQARLDALELTGPQAINGPWVGNSPELDAVSWEGNYPEMFDPPSAGGRNVQEAVEERLADHPDPMAGADDTGIEEMIAVDDLVTLRVVFPPDDSPETYEDERDWGEGDPMADLKRATEEARKPGLILKGNPARY